MPVQIESLLTPEQTAAICGQLDSPEAVWVPGSTTAGWHAKPVKQNHQLEPGSALQVGLASSLQETFLRHPLVQAVAFPREMHGLLISRSRSGEGYGRHVDNAWMAGGRSDLSWTLWLSEPEHYEGGALVLELPTGEEAFRLPAGHALLYPSTLLHRVEPVLGGERLVAVGWIQSRIRHAEQRELLFDLDTARRALYQRSGNDEVFALISRSYSNLLRRWDR